MGKKAKKQPDDPRAVVRKLMKSGKVKKRCCRSSSRCKKCPVMALKKAKTELTKAA
ncbi:MAG TPA: hypothetical protein VG674_02240 [Amycolatopsis sp.]|jgi:hypothetical protein|nr:hypothetical protein [Amycolatopsis sp.]